MDVGALLLCSMKSRNQGVYSSSITTQTRSIKSHALVIEATQYRHWHAQALCIITCSLFWRQKNLSSNSVISKSFHSWYQDTFCGQTEKNKWSRTDCLFRFLWCWGSVFFLRLCGRYICYNFDIQPYKAILYQPMYKTSCFIKMYMQFLAQRFVCDTEQKFVHTVRRFHGPEYLEPT
jgi:hypothetical protein